MAAWEGLVLGLFPLAFFFGFLFYTDLASLALVLLSYERSLSEKWVVSAMVSL
jgi:alpha-1,2-glucosyltransferase